MSKPKLFQDASLESMKKLAKERLLARCKANPKVKLSTAQLGVAQEYGFASWRALKAELDRRCAARVDAFFVACRAGDVAALCALLEKEPRLVHERNDGGQSGLHVAVAHVDAVRRVA